MNEHNRALFEKCAAITGRENCLLDEPMARHTTFRIGGPADCFLTPRSASELQELLKLISESSVPHFIMGNGSNLLVSDEGYRGIVISIGRNMSRIRVEGTTIEAEAGAFLSGIAAKAKAASLTGFEFAGGIPGTLGGACVMNAGAYGGEMKQVLRSVTCIDETGQLRTVDSEELELGYRSSALMRNGWIAVGARLLLSEGRQEEIEALTNELRERRCAKQPLDKPSAGSTFKRPEGYFAGKLIMDAGLRGYSVGGAAVSEKHCGFVVNNGGATAADVLQLMRDVERIVEEKFGVRLTPEVRFLGEMR